MYVRVGRVLFFLLSALLHASEIRGKVVSVVGAEPLARVQVAVLETGAKAVTGRNGTFAIQNLAPGHYTLRLNAVGYRLVTVPFSLTAGEELKGFDVTLAPDNFRRTDKVEVKGDIFQGPDSPAVIETNLTSTEIRETSTVLADDPFRAIQTLPGVSASGNNDFYAQFSVMGEPFENISTYLDGILVPQPFHGLTNISEGATLSILTSETLEDLKLLPVAYPEKFGDAVGVALDMHSRDGSRTFPIFRASVGLADTELLGEGKIGRNGRGSWLASARKSYLGYLLRNRLNENYTDVSFYDGALKLTYDVRPNQTVTFYGVGGHTFADLLRGGNPDPNFFKHGTNDFIMARAGWRWAVSPRFLFDARAAYLHAPYKTWNRFDQVLSDNHHGEWVGGGDLVWTWRPGHVLEGGWTVRRVNNRSAATFYDPNDNVTSNVTRGGEGWKHNGYLQEATSFFNNRLHVLGSLRLDTAQQFQIHPVSPQVSASLQIARATQLQFGVGRYNQFQFPGIPQFDLGTGLCVPPFEILQTANHYTVGVEQRIGESTRVKAIFFDREGDTSDAVNRPDNCNSSAHPHGFIAFQHAHSRGAQVVLQSRTANRLSGWVGYTLTYSRESFLMLRPDKTLVWSPYFPTLADQRHTVNVFASYRLNPTVHVSGKWLFGSGFPIPSANDATRLGDYQRLDLRGEKDWAFKNWKLALYGEVLNLTNHNNPRYFYSSYNSDGMATVTTGQSLPITPTAGVAFEF